MQHAPMQRQLGRARWTAIGAAVAVTLGAGGMMTARAVTNSGERSVFTAVTPCRIMDTRPAPATVGARSKPLGAADTHTIAVVGSNGNCTLPADVVAVSLNVTAVNPTADSFLTVFPADAPQPLASNLNYVPNQPPVPNAVTVDLSADGKISFFNNGGTVDVVADVVGYFADHDHDDRYYTETEVNAHEARQKFISLDLVGNQTDSSLYLSEDDAGLILKESTPRYLPINFLAPPDLTPGTNMTLQIMFTIDQTSCSVSLRPAVISVDRLGEVTAGTIPFAPKPLPGLVAVGGDPRPAPAPAGAVTMAEYRLGRASDGSGLVPGDSVSLVIARDGTTDTCTKDVFVTGAQLVYD